MRTFVGITTSSLIINYRISGQEFTLRFYLLLNIVKRIPAPPTDLYLLGVKTVFKSMFGTNDVIVLFEASNIVEI